MVVVDRRWDGRGALPRDCRGSSRSSAETAAADAFAATATTSSPHVIHCLAEHRIRVTDFRTELPTLEDVFLKLTGHSIRD